MAANSNALIFWIAVVVAVGGLVLRWWPPVVIVRFVVVQWRWVGTYQEEALKPIRQICLVADPIAA